MTTDPQDVTVPLAGGRALHAQLLLPAGEPPAGGWPAVVVVHEAFGLTPEITTVGRSFADRDWVAIVPDLFSAGVKVGCLVRSMREMLAGAPGAVTDDLLAVQQWVRSRSEVDADRTAAIGFCMGGAFALLLGSLGPAGLRAVSDNYGRLPAQRVDLTRCPPVIGSFGAEDTVLPGAGDALAARLTVADVEHDVRSYDGAGHSFLTGDHKLFGVVPLGANFAYSASAAGEAWPRILDFLERHTAVR
ncbi:dienelactone hydrolase family protein [Goekera deserti]|uniref:Dienelactone hydrolase family protein n=1 Tax=Goekera deserti TaxID=2497753 RepID=A0A7K3W9R8_9ACTN|nr:dienelactone hydrolase family protein [Goekera deserti]NDI49721.1 dienelactone hydrolase family protein [Goekera deserti]NEL53086.1 dienelactone hydrolase family protein [Goekera deserti]